MHLGSKTDKVQHDVASCCVPVFKIKELKVNRL